MGHSHSLSSPELEAKSVSRQSFIFIFVLATKRERFFSAVPYDIIELFPSCIFLGNKVLVRKPVFPPMFS